MFALPSFSLSDMVASSAELRQVARGSRTMEGAADSVVRYLRGAFLDPATGLPDFVLARFFQTQRFDRLPPDLQDFLRDAHPGLRLDGQLRCLTLLATDGDEPAWCDRRKSVSHRAIPLPSAEAVAEAPMVSALIEDLGVRPAAVVDPSPDEHRNDFGVFFVPTAAGSPRIPAQDFVRRHGVRSALGFGGVLPSGDLFAVVLFARAAIPRAVADMFGTLAVSTKVALLPYAGGPTFEGQDIPVTSAPPLSAQLAAVEQLLNVEEDTARRQAQLLEARERSLQHQISVSRTLQEVGRALASELDSDRLAQLVVDAATKLTGATAGAFCFDTIDVRGRKHQFRALSGAAASGVDEVSLPSSTALFPPRARGGGAVRAADITEDPSYGMGPPGPGMLPDEARVRSYLAVPVPSRSGEVLGGLFLGHPSRGHFVEEHEQLAVGVAAQAATALDNARLYRRERDTALELQRALLPEVPTRLNSLEVASRYLPGGQGAQVGGDWFDAIPLGAGRAALVIGDVMGRGVHAAALMGQVRTAVRAYAAMDLSPAEVVRRLNDLVCAMTEDFIATCVFAVYDPGTSSLTYANAGHLPPLWRQPSGAVAFLDGAVGTPIGVHAGVFDEAYVRFELGSRLLLYTDGLVETRDEAISEGLTSLLARFTELADRPEVDDDTLLGGLEAPDQEDDVAMLLVHANDPCTFRVSRRFDPRAESAVAARDFARSELSPVPGIEEIVLAVGELVTNAVKHARTPFEVTLRKYSGGIAVEVFDRDSRLPQLGPIDSAHEARRGLLIVASVASRWGARRGSGGKVVWAEFDVEDGQVGNCGPAPDPTQ